MCTFYTVRERVTWTVERSARAARLLLRGKVEKHNPVAAMDDAQIDERLAGHRMSASFVKVRAVISVPLGVPDGRMLGVLSVHFDERRTLDLWAQRALKAPAHRCAAAIDRAL
jgi:GAF domain-containing protein